MFWNAPIRTRLSPISFNSDIPTFELNSLELAAAQARSAGFNRVNFESLAEILRTIGR